MYNFFRIDFCERIRRNPGGVAILTCKSFEKLGKRDERQTESLIPSAVSLRRAGVEQLYQVRRMIGGIGNMCCSFSHEKTQSGTRALHDMCCSKPLTFHNGFMFVASRSCFKHLFRFQALLVF